MRRAARRRTRTRATLGVAVCLGIVAAVAVVPALALIPSGGPPEIVSDRVVRLVSLETAAGRHASVWSAPAAEGGQCVLLLVTRDATARPSNDRHGGGVCSGPGAPAQTAPLRLAVSWLRVRPDEYEVVLDGSVAPGSRIRRVELASAGETVALPFAGGHFVGELPSVSSSGDLPSGGPFVVVGYGANGDEVGRMDVADVAAPPGAP